MGSQRNYPSFSDRTTCIHILSRILFGEAISLTVILPLIVHLGSIPVQCKAQFEIASVSRLYWFHRLLERWPYKLVKQKGSALIERLLLRILGSAHDLVLQDSRGLGGPSSNRGPRKNVVEKTSALYS